MAFGVSYLYTLATQNIVIKNYGALQHEIGYDPGNITVEEVDRIAEALTSAVYFDSRVEKDGRRHERRREIRAVSLLHRLRPE